MDLAEARKTFPPIWVVYDHPRDYPDKWVVRVWYGEVSEPDCTVHDSREDARESISSRGGGMCFAPYLNDDPCIAEWWI